jgi:hypothetical protein
MTLGVAVVKAKPSWANMLLGVNNQNLWFVPVEPAQPKLVQAATINGDGELLQQAYHPRAAFHCPDCKTVVLDRPTA